MAYIGNTAASRFVSNRAASVFSGDGSAVAFTLEQSVAQDEDILVSVDGVIQEPSVAYAVSSGTILTFTAAPSTNSGNNIFVYYLASQVGTVGHPSTQGLAATSGTFSTTLSSTGNATVGGTIAVTGTSTLTGVTALGNTGSTVKSEGGAVTTNIAQGLAKMWCSFQGTGTAAILDSFNTDGFSDDGGNGKFTITIASDYSNANYSAVSTGGTLAAGGIDDVSVARVNNSAATLALETVRGSDNNLTDFAYIATATFGDLA